MYLWQQNNTILSWYKFRKYIFHTRLFIFFLHFSFLLVACNILKKITCYRINWCSLFLNHCMSWISDFVWPNSSVLVLMDILFHPSQYFGWSVQKSWKKMFKIKLISPWCEFKIINKQSIVYYNTHTSGFIVSIV